MARAAVKTRVLNDVYGPIPRFSWDVLYRFVSARVAPDPDYGFVTDTQMEELTGKGRQAIKRWRTGEFGMTYISADEVAVWLGVHPCEIWGDAWFVPSMYWEVS